MREPKNQMLGTMEPPLMQLSVNIRTWIYIYNRFGQSFKLLGRVVTMETAIFTLILIY